MKSTLFLCILFCGVIKYGQCECFFPTEYQGVFVTQSPMSVGASHIYSEVVILPDAVPVWGACHEKFGNSVILYDKTGDQDCIRCFQFNLHSSNVIQVFTEGLDRCYTTVEAAIATCPTENDIEINRAREVMLYKKSSFRLDGKIDKVFCPFGGMFYFTYFVNDGSRSPEECREPNSRVSTCPRGSQLNFRFRDCTFGELDMRYECLGHWTSRKGLKHVAFRDVEVASSLQPQYRCAIYEEDRNTGKVYIGLSIDATCTNSLASPWDGYENLVLNPVQPPIPPVEAQLRTCIFPLWAQGNWQNLKISGTSMIAWDTATDSRLDIQCMEQHGIKNDRFSLYQRSQCGQEVYTCVWIKKRDSNVIEYVFGEEISTLYNGTHLCSDNMFRRHKWITQGRLDQLKHTGCPVKGEYTGIMPDDSTLCTNLASDCKRPDQMYYTVSPCSNLSQYYEDREYTCLGQWEESGVTYTYTHRHDVNKYECFAGVVVSPREAYIIEAGTSCERGLQPLANGMKLVKKASCAELQKKKTPPNRLWNLPSWMTNQVSNNNAYRPPWKMYKDVKKAQQKANSAGVNLVAIPWSLLMISFRFLL